MTRARDGSERRTGAQPAALRTALSAIENASTVPVTPAQVGDMLATGTGHPSHLRALFGDVDLGVLERVAAAFDIAPHALHAAYRRAQAHVGAENDDLNALLQADARTGLTGAEPT